MTNDITRAADHAARQHPADLPHMSLTALLSVQAAYMLVPHEERSSFVQVRMDEIAQEVSERARPLHADLTAVYAAIDRGDWRRAMDDVIGPVSA